MQEEGQPDFVQEMIGLYLAETPPLLAAIQEAIAQGDAGGLQQAAHTLKSSSRNLGALPVAALSLALELLGRSGTVAGAAVLLAELQRQSCLANQALQSPR